MATVTGTVGGVKRDFMFKVFEESRDKSLGNMTKKIRRKYPDLTSIQVRTVYNQYHCFKQLNII